MYLSRADTDELCWHIMRDRPRPRGVLTDWHNFEYLGREMLLGMEWQDALYAFNHRFAAYRLASFFDLRPPDWLRPIHP